MKIILIFILLKDNISLCKKLLLISFTAGLPFYNSNLSKNMHVYVKIFICILYLYTVTVQNDTPIF